MTQSDTENLIAPLQVIQRIQTLGIDPATFDTPEANWKNLYNSVMTRLSPGHRRNRPSCEFYRFQPGRTE